MKSVSAYKTRLDQGNAYWMARIARAVYQKVSDDNQLPDEGSILAELKADDSGFLAVHGYDNNSAQAALIVHDDYYCMAFRGTNEPRDWLDNINVEATKELFGKFHLGFWGSVEDIWTPMYEKYVTMNKEQKRPLFFTGHSLGGAMATIAAARLIHRDLPFTSVYTFGQPRAMSRKTSRIFNAECKERFFRFHNNNDIVPRVPGRVMDYSHVGTYIYITKEKRLQQEPGSWFRFLDNVDGALEALKEQGIDGVEDHDMKHYLQAVEAWDME